MDMQTKDPRPAPNRKRLWAGRIITAVVALFLVVDATIKVMRIEAVIQAFEQIGWPTDLAFPIGVILLACVVVYLVPRTAVLGAVLLTGYLGGAVSAQLRIEAPLLGFTLFPVYVGVLVWLGLYLRDHALRAFVRQRLGAEHSLPMG